MHPLRKVALRGHYDQMKMILHQDITIHFDTVALCAFSEIAQKLPSISIIPENLFPSISTRHDVVHGPANSIRGGRDTLLCNHAKVIGQRLTRTADPPDPET